MHTLLAVQIFVPVDAALWRHDLLERLRSSEDAPDPLHKAHFWRGVCELLRGGLDDAHFGVWDYVDDDERALEEYDQWCTGTVADAAEDLDIEPDVDAVPYLFATILLLCDADGPSDLILREAIEAAEDDPWSRRTFASLLDTIAGLDWRGTKSDTLFVRPGDDGWGVPGSRLQEEHYHYLQPLL